MTEFHPLAELFPMMTAAEVRALAVDVKQHGLLEPVTLYEGKVLDGRNRYTACALAGVEIKFVEWDGSADTPLAYVLSKNASRRHLTVGQRAMVGARLVDEVYAAEAATRKAQALKKAADAVGANLSPRDDAGKSAAKAAAAMGVSEGSVKTARRIRKDGAQAIVAKVESGEMSLNEAAQTLAQQEIEHDDDAADFVPSPEVVERVAAVRKALAGLSADWRAIEEGLGALAIHFPALSVQHAAAVRRVLEETNPAPCPACVDGNKCQACGGSGMLTKPVFDKLPREQRRRVNRGLLPLAWGVPA